MSKLLQNASAFACRGENGDLPVDPDRLQFLLDDPEFALIRFVFGSIRAVRWD
jgi:hypothetical protein